MMASANMRTMLEDLRSRIDGTATALISRDGRVLLACLPEGAYIETFGVMCATIFGAAAAANVELHRTPPVRIVIEGDDVRTLIVRTDGNALLVAVVNGSGYLPAVLEQMMRFVGVLTAE
jgi:predicted regulator of Ras-like GTPase activity (Roadblock/LC7/MglB family)